MCGICGFWQSDTGDLAAIARRMSTEIRHRGPDDSGVWTDENVGIALGHRRLSIVDLSSAGHQPMVSPCGRYVLSFNGEIYNHAKLRLDLAQESGHFDWRGHSDTETLLAALRHWGVDGALSRLNGMFAFALWDSSEQVLILARDRMGEKPLFYGKCSSSFLFGSELKSLLVHPAWNGSVDRGALTQYMRHGYVPSPRSIYSGILKVPPAHYVIVSDQGRNVSEPVCYWSLAAHAEAGVTGSDHDEQEQVNGLDGLLREAVGQRMMADVPLGAFLSGGIDSSVVVAQMQAQSDRPVNTFSIGFNEDSHDEAKHAKVVANHLGTNHTELYVSPEEAMTVIPKLPTLWDEPFADPSQIPTYLVSELARKHVTVCLSGDGGDELFYGYNRYTYVNKVWRNTRKMPDSTRRLVSGAIARIPGRHVDRALRLLSKKLRFRNFEDSLRKWAEILAHENPESFYQGLVSHWKNPHQIVLASEEPKARFGELDRMPNLPSFRDCMMYIDQVTYLPDDILAKVDRASMAVSLEARVPMLDHRLVEFAWNLPMEFKYRAGQQKWLLRQVLYRYVPRELVDRPKMGFGVPIEHWLRGPLREWADDLLNEKRIREQGFFDPKPIRKMWFEHVSGQRRWHYRLWDVLMFQAWLAQKK